MAKVRTRFLVAHDLASGGVLELSDGQAHQLRDVLRARAGERVALFNGRDGEWLGEIERLGRRDASVRLVERVRLQRTEPDLWLCFAPIKRARLDFLVEKAVELGAAALQPVLTERTAVERVNLERLAANAVEAAEQTERLTVPAVRDPVPLARLLDSWPAERRLLLCDETGGGRPVAEALAGLDAASRAAPWAILTGPEGGFARAELDRIAALPAALAVGLGPRILRADTAALAAMAVWQAALGDWRESGPPRVPDYAARG